MARPGMSQDSRYKNRSVCDCKQMQRPFWVRGNWGIMYGDENDWLVRNSFDHNDQWAMKDAMFKVSGAVERAKRARTEPRSGVPG